MYHAAAKCQEAAATGARPGRERCLRAAQGCFFPSFDAAAGLAGLEDGECRIEIVLVGGTKRAGGEWARLCRGGARNPIDGSGIICKTTEGGQTEEHGKRSETDAVVKPSVSERRVHDLPRSGQKAEALALRVGFRSTIPAPLVVCQNMCRRPAKSWLALPKRPQEL